MTRGWYHILRLWEVYIIENVMQRLGPVIFRFKKVKFRFIIAKIEFDEIIIYPKKTIKIVIGIPFNLNYHLNAENNGFLNYNEWL